MISPFLQKRLFEQPELPHFKLVLEFLYNVSMQMSPVSFCSVIWHFCCSLLLSTLGKILFYAFFDSSHSWTKHSGGPLFLIVEPPFIVSPIRVRPKSFKIIWKLQLFSSVTHQKKKSQLGQYHRLKSYPMKELSIIPATLRGRLYFSIILHLVQPPPEFSVIISDIQMEVHWEAVKQLSLHNKLSEL